LNLHAIACALVDRHGGGVPDSYDDLLALPGIGPYTAAAVASFAFRQRHAVLDTNVRRVLARLVNAEEHPPKARTAAEQTLAEHLLPDDAARAARWAAASMELGALVCTARAPSCGTCPVVADCAWHNAGRPAYQGPPRRGQSYAGTDRQCRGRLLGVLRDADGPVTRPALDAAWSEPVQRARALDTLVADGLIDPLPDGTFALPGTLPAT
jgi:A/G-specific adenine glycosylase